MRCKMKRVKRFVCAMLISVMLLVSFAVGLPNESKVAYAASAISANSLQIAHAAVKKITVYYTPKGTKYHKTKKCRTLKRSKKIYSKKVKASSIKKGKRCKVCWH